MRVSIITPFSGSTAHLCEDYFAAVQGCDELILVDDKSDQETAALLKNTDAIYIRHDQRKGFAASNNDGYRVASGDIVVFLNSDISTNRHSRWLDSVKETVKDGLYGHSSYQIVYGLRMPYIEGWCVAAQRVTWERLKVDDGPWDAKAYSGPYWEDNDLSLRATKQGIDLFHVAWPLTHKGGQTIGVVSKYGESYETNRTTYASRVRDFWLTQVAK